MYVCMMHISMVLDLDPEACMYVSFLTLMFVCMCDAYVLDPDTCDHDAHTYYAFIHDPDTCVYDAFINVPRSLTLMHVCMMHISMILDR